MINFVFIFGFCFGVAGLIYAFNNIRTKVQKEEMSWGLIEWDVALIVGALGMIIGSIGHFIKYGK